MLRNFSKNAEKIETTDVVSGELFDARTENHYEANDGVPMAPAVQLPRKSLRERVEELYRGGRMLQELQHDGSADDDMDVAEFDDPEPLTPAEKNYLVTEGMKTLNKAYSEAAGAPQPSPAPNPPPEGQNAPAGSVGPAPSPSAPKPPGT